MTTQQKLMILGSNSFDMDNYVECKYDSISIWHDVVGSSCKISITDPRFCKVLPTSGGFALMELDVATTILASVLEELIDRELGRQVLACYSRFRISNEGQELNRRRKT